MSVRIYALVDPRSGAIRYVGKTIGSLHVRLRSHICDVGRGRVYIPRHKWILELLQDKLEPTIVLLDEVDEANWRSAEQSWIANMRAAGADLLNATDGGDGLVGYQHRESTRAKQSVSAKARYERQGEKEKTGAAVAAAYASPEARESQRRRAAAFTPEHMALFHSGGARHARSPEGRAIRSRNLKGRTITDEWREKISKAMMGHKRSAESIKKQRQALTGRPLSESHKAAIIAGRRRFFDRRKEANP